MDGGHVAFIRPQQSLEEMLMMPDNFMRPEARQNSGTYIECSTGIHVVLQIPRLVLKWMPSNHAIFF